MVWMKMMVDLLPMKKFLQLNEMIQSCAAVPLVE